MSETASFLEEYHEAMKVAGRLKASVERAEEHVRIVFSEEVVASTEKSVSRAEHLSRASSTYCDAVNELQEARCLYSDAAAKVEYLKARFEAWRTNMASARERQRLGGSNASTQANQQGRKESSDERSHG